MKKLVAVDMEGTFLDNSNQYNRTVFQKIYNYFKENEVLFVVTSENQYYQLKSFFDDNQNIIYVCENGALIMQNQQEIYHQSIPFDHVKKITDIIKKNPHIQICLCGLKSAYLYNGTPECYKHFSHYYHHLDIIHSLDEIDDEILKFALWVPQSNNDILVSALKDKLNKYVQIISSGYESIDLMSHGCHKGKAIERICQKYNISLDDCIAFGDSENDLEMIKVVKYGYAVENAKDILKENAYGICPSCNEHGVLRQLIEIFDIKLDELLKATLGMWYDANNDPKVLDEIHLAHHLCYKFNQTDPYNQEIKQKYLSQLLKQELNNVTIISPLFCDRGYNIQLGKNVFINYNAYLMDGAKITIGDNVFIGPSAGLYTAIHPLDYTRRNSGIEKAKPITIGDNVWLGGNVVILPGVTIGSGSVIGAGSVVTKDIPENVLAIGNPCKVVKTINQNYIKDI